MFPQHSMGGGPAIGTDYMDPTAMAAATVQVAVRQQNENAARVRADRMPLEHPWRDPRFFPITPENAVIYFCQRENPFFDPTSDNALIMMNNPGITPTQHETILKSMKGTQYVLVEPSSPPLFVIRRQQRTAPDKITPLCHFYVLDGTVYQAPDLHTLIHSRLVSIMDPLKNAFTETLDMLRFNPSKGHSWEFKSKPAKKVEEEEPEQQVEGTSEKGAAKTANEDEEDPLSVRATPYQRLRTDMLLRILSDESGVGNMNKQDKMMEVDSPANIQQHSATGVRGMLEQRTADEIVTSVLNFQGLFFASQQQQQHLEVGQDNNDPMFGENVGGMISQNRH